MKEIFIRVLLIAKLVTLIISCSKSPERNVILESQRENKLGLFISKIENYNIDTLRYTNALVYNFISSNSNDFTINFNSNYSSLEQKCEDEKAIISPKGKPVCSIEKINNYDFLIIKSVNMLRAVIDINEEESFYLTLFFRDSTDNVIRSKDSLFFRSIIESLELIEEEK